MRTQQKAFTLIELLIVVAIIAILAAIAVPNFLEAQTRAKVSRTVSDMRSIATAVEAYIIDNNNVPILPELRSQYADVFSDFLMVYNGRVPLPGRMLTTPIAYMTSIPVDPFNTTLIWGNEYYLKDKSQKLSASVNINVVPLNRPTTFRDQIVAAWAMGSSNMPRNWRFFFESAGPDQKWWTWAGGDIWRPESVSRFFYDPTNGTLSEGQLLYFQGGIAYPRR